jgi:thymidylate synthase (FAD)
MEVTYIDHMGDDLRVVNAARVSFHKESDWEYIFAETGELISQDVYDSDQKLIKYLAKHEHWTPFAHVYITMVERVPIFVARQRFKHTVGFVYNEVSRRYVDDQPTFYTPETWRARPVDGIKQGSSDEVITHLKYVNDDYYHNGSMPFILTHIKEEYECFIAEAERLYNKMIEDGVAPEQARMVLPQSMYTEYYVTGSLAAWARAYRLRSDSHAQKEIRNLADKWQDVIGKIEGLEHSWQALTG